LQREVWFVPFRDDPERRRELGRASITGTSGSWLRKMPDVPPDFVLGSRFERLPISHVSFGIHGSQMRTRMGERTAVPAS
jgi:hypothetical protein